jgi:NAD(P)H-nitrite reductase large subunit
VLPGRKRISYDRLVIATGASAAPLTIETSRENPVLTLRKVEDLHRIAERARRSQKILIIGAGLIGLHLAQIFYQVKKKVHVIELKDQVLPGLIPSGLALQVKGLFEENGVRISLGVRLETLGKKEGRLSNGDRVGADLAIAAIGIRTNWEVVQGTSIAVREGIVVNDRMETSLPGIYACGDVAEYRDFFTGESRLNPNLVSAAEQGRTVAAALLGKSDRHPGLISINTFRCFGCELVSLGRIEADVGDRLLEEGDVERKFYKRMIFRDGRLKGLSFFNIPVDSGLYYKLVRERVSLEGKEERLFREPFLLGKAVAQRASKA